MTDDLIRSALAEHHACRSPREIAAVRAVLAPLCAELETLRKELEEEHTVSRAIAETWRAALGAETELLDEPRLIARARQMRAALRGLLERYCSLVSSADDCADWNPETHDEVVAARRALGDAPEGT